LKLIKLYLCSRIYARYSAFIRLRIEKYDRKYGYWNTMNTKYKCMAMTIEGLIISNLIDKKYNKIS